jgi:hypothetical protein
VEIFRVASDVYGQETLEGISWDLLPVAIGLGLAVIVGHAVYRLVRGKRGH